MGQGPTDEQPMMLPAAEPTTIDAHIVEDIAGGKQVGDPQCGHIAYFMDGMQRPRGPVYVGSSIPWIYGYVAATIRARGVDKKMRKHDHEHRESLYFPYALTDWRPLHALGIDTVDTSEREQKTDEHPLMMAERAKKKISGVREDLEKALTSDWLRDFDGREEWLLVDGSLSGDYDRYEAPNLIGAIKSHQSQYYDRASDRVIPSTELRAGERSGVFIPGGRNRPPVYSWYLRLRPNDGRDLYFGLVRVEAAKCDRTLEMADEISRWLLAERAPLSMPDARWDRMIYPIRDCELYLKSLAPAHATLDALLLKLTAVARQTIPNEMS